MDEATIGARLRVLRRWRGMTQVALAGLSGLSPSFISMVETGQRPLDRRSHIGAIASALRVSETDLVGGPHLSADRQQSDPHRVIPALREALLVNRLTTPAAERARPLADLTRIVAGLAVPRLAEADLTGAGAPLPEVIDELHWHAARPADEAARRLALETLIDACIVVSGIAMYLGFGDLEHVAALRAEEAADLLADPVQRGKADFLRLSAFPRERASDRRLAVAEAAADQLEPHARDPLGLQVLGMLTLNAAMSAALVQRTGSVEHWLAESRQLASRVDDDISGNWQSFSATNVALWTLAIAVERGEAGGAVLELASTVDQSSLTRRNRRAYFMVDVSRGLAREPKTRTEAIAWLRRAEQAAPQLVRNHPPASETVTFLLGRIRADAGGRELRGMAARMGVPH